MSPTGHIVHKAILPKRETQKIYLIHRNKQTETAKLTRQRSNFQTKVKEGSPEKKLYEIDASKLSDIEFKVMVIRMLKELNVNYISIKKGHRSYA